MKQILARALGCKQEKLKSSQFQQKGYLLTPETTVPGMELIPGMTGGRDSKAFSLCLLLSHGILSTFLLQEMSFLCLALGVVEGSM